MPKKDFSSGISLLIQNPATSAQNNKNDDKPIPKKQEMEIQDQTSVHFRMPVSLKISMEHYCTDHRMKQQELIISAIAKYITP